MSILAPNSSSHQIFFLSREIYHHHHQQQSSSSSSSSCCWSNGGGRNCWVQNSSSVYGFGGIVIPHRSRRKRDTSRVEAGFWSADVSRPVTIEMEPIADSDQLDQILASAQQASQPILIDWMASWCRKCIYLKPKLEKLAAEYDTKIKFYCVDVNKVPLALVKRGNISKMPTIQLWKDGEMKEEVIGGHKAWLVMDEVREMIHKFL